jgi:hypothetical protein
MSGKYGRIIRAVMGVSLVGIAILGMNYYLLLLIPGGFMIWTAIVSYCPATLLFPAARKEENILTNRPTYKLK